MLSSFLLQKVNDLSVDASERQAIINMLEARPSDWEAVINLEGFDCELLPVAIRLPKEFQTPGLTRVMATVDMLGHFVDLVEKLAVAEFPDQRKLFSDLGQAANSWGELTSVMKEIYLRMPLPEQVVPNDGMLNYLPTGLAILEADRKFKTTLHRQLPMITRSNSQVYEWCGEPNLLLVLSRYRTRWILASVWNQDGEEIDRDDSIVSHLRTYGLGSPPELIDRVELFQKAGEFDLNMVLVRLL